jgi:hypothetical protein
VTVAAWQQQKPAVSFPHGFASGQPFGTHEPLFNSQLTPAAYATLAPVVRIAAVKQIVARMKFTRTNIIAPSLFEPLYGFFGAASAVA